MELKKQFLDVFSHKFWDLAVLSYVVIKHRLWSENVIQVLGGGTSSDRGYLRFARVSRGWRALLVVVFPSFLPTFSHGKGVSWSDFG